MTPITAQTLFEAFRSNAAQNEFTIMEKVDTLSPSVVAEITGPLDINAISAGLCAPEQLIQALRSLIANRERQNHRHHFSALLARPKESLISGMVDFDVLADELLRVVNPSPIAYTVEEQNALALTVWAAQSEQQNRAGKSNERGHIQTIAFAYLRDSQDTSQAQHWPHMAHYLRQAALDHAGATFRSASIPDILIAVATDLENMSAKATTTP